MPPEDFYRLPSLTPAPSPPLISLVETPPFVIPKFFTWNRTCPNGSVPNLPLTNLSPFPPYLLRTPFSLLLILYKSPKRPSLAIRQYSCSLPFYGLTNDLLTSVLVFGTLLRYLHPLFFFHIIPLPTSYASANYL